MSPEQVLSIIGLVTAAWTITRIFRGPLGDALARRIGGPSLPSADHQGELADLRVRVAELEERVDFAERVLLRERQPGELPQGGRS